MSKKHKILEKIIMNEIINEMSDEALVHMSPLQRKCYDIGRYPLLTREEEDELVSLIKMGDLEAREWFICCNMRLVVYFAWKMCYSKKEEDLLDAIQAGEEGIYAAVDRFEANDNNRFAAYAGEYIRGYILNYFNKKRREIVPKEFQKKLNCYKKIKSDYYKDNGEEISLEELAKIMDLSKEEILEIESYDYRFCSLDAPKNNDDKSMGTFGEFVEDKKSFMNSFEEESEATKRMKEVLTEEEIEILRMRGGIWEERSKQEERSVGVVSEVMGMTKIKVLQLEARALHKLKLNEEYIMGKK